MRVEGVRFSAQGVGFRLVKGARLPDRVWGLGFRV